MHVQERAVDAECTHTLHVELWAKHFDGEALLPFLGAITAAESCNGALCTEVVPVVVLARGWVMDGGGVLLVAVGGVAVVVLLVVVVVAVGSGACSRS